MWNAYKGSTVALPGRDVRFEDVTVDGALNFSNYDTFNATVTQEDASTSVVQIAVLKVGDIINLYIPQLSVTGTYSQAYKSIPIPLAYQPVAADQAQALVSNQNNTPGVGSCYFASVSELRLYTKADRTNPTNSVASIIRPQMISYFKSL